MMMSARSVPSLSSIRMAERMPWRQEPGVRLTKEAGNVVPASIHHPIIVLRLKSQRQKEMKIRLEPKVKEGKVTFWTGYRMYGKQIDFTDFIMGYSKEEVIEAFKKKESELQRLRDDRHTAESLTEIVEV